MLQVICRENIINSSNYKVICSGEMKCPDGYTFINTNFTEFIKNFEGPNVSLMVYEPKEYQMNFDLRKMPPNLKNLTIKSENYETKIKIKMEPNVFEPRSIKIINCSIEMLPKSIKTKSLELKNSEFVESVSVDAQTFDTDMCGLNNAYIGEVFELSIDNICHKSIEIDLVVKRTSDINVRVKSAVADVYFYGRTVNIDRKNYNGSKLSIESECLLNLNILTDPEMTTSLNIYHLFVSQIISNIKVAFINRGKAIYRFLPSTWVNCAINQLFFDCYSKAEFKIKCYHVPAKIVSHNNAQITLSVRNIETTLESLDLSGPVRIISLYSFNIESLYTNSNITVSSSAKLVISKLSILSTKNQPIQAFFNDILVKNELALWDAYVVANTVSISKNASISLYETENFSTIECNDFVYEGDVFSNIFIVCDQTVQSMAQNTTYKIIVSKDSNIEDKIQNISYKESYAFKKYKSYDFQVYDTDLILQKSLKDSAIPYHQICVVKDLEKTDKCSDGFIPLLESEIGILEDYNLINLLIVEVLEDISPEYAFSFRPGMSLDIYGRNEKKPANIYMNSDNFTHINFINVNVTFNNIKNITAFNILLGNSILKNIDNITSEIILLQDFDFNNYPKLFTSHYVINEALNIKTVKAEDDKIVFNDKYTFAFNEHPIEKIFGSLSYGNRATYYANSDSIAKIEVVGTGVSDNTLNYYSNKSISNISTLNFQNVYFHTEFLPKKLTTKGYVRFFTKEPVTYEMDSITISGLTKFTSTLPIEIVAKNVSLIDESNIELENVTLITDNLFFDSNSINNSSTVIIRDKLFIGNTSRNKINIIFKPNENISDLEINVSYSMGNVPYVNLGTLINTNITDEHNNAIPEQIKINMNNFGGKEQLFIEDEWANSTLDVLCFNSLEEITNVTSIKSEWHSKEWKFNLDDCFFDLIPHKNCLSIIRREKEIPNDNEKELSNNNIIIFTCIIVAGVLVVLIPAAILIHQLIKKKRMNKYISSEISTPLI